MGCGKSGLLDDMAANDRRFGALYRDVAKAFGLSESSMWVLYYIHSAGEPIAQHDLVGCMAQSKQTVNSAVSNLVAKGHVELVPIPGTRNRKKVVLTAAGSEVAERTVARMRAAEERAVRALGDEKTRLYIELHDEFLDALNDELTKEGILDGE